MRRPARAPRAGSVGGLRLAALLGVALAVAVSGCGDAGAAARSGPDLTIFAAASLNRPLAGLLEAYEVEAPDVEVETWTDSSTALRVQIEQGAPADVFLPADMANAEALIEAGLTRGTAVPFAASRLVVIVPAGKPTGIRTPADLARPGVRIIAAGEGVPITKYALDVVGRLEAVDGYPRGFARSYAANVVSREDNVRGVVTRIELGEGDAAIVYSTDVAGAEDVEAIEIPPAANARPIYSAVVLARDRQPETAAAFVDWLAGPDAWAVLQAFGFERPAP